MLRKSMPFLEHLEELRKRILISLAAILVVTSVALIFSDTILKVLLIPAGGILNVPNYARHCTCNYPVSTSLALVTMPETTAWDSVGH